MERKWTPSQLSAIETHGKNLLVSASAGSGKTAALTERIIRSLVRSADSSCDYEYKTDISRMLIVTFTKAAASELRERISAALSKALAVHPDSEYLRRQIIQLPSAHISTIDAFYMNTVRSHFSSLGITSAFRIGDTAELTVIYHDIMDEVIEHFFNMTDKEGLDFAKFADNFTNARTDSSLKEKLLKVYSQLTQYPEGIKLLKTFAEEYRNADGDFFDCRCGKAVKLYIEGLLTDYINICDHAVNELSWDAALAKTYAPAFAADAAFYREWLQAMQNGGYASACEVARDFKFKSLVGSKKVEDIKLKEKYSALRNSMKSRINSAREMLKAFPEEIPYYLNATADICDILYEVLSEYEQKVLNEKISRGIFDFSDITRFTFDLLIDKNGAPTDVARSIAEQYDEIFIDEYQDTNAIQDAIFNAIARNNRFMVGDIKQSIYSFRGARPDIFAEYRKRFPSLSECEGDSASVFMSENFRCDENIIKFVNTISSYTFGLCSESIGFTDEDNLIFSKLRPYDNYTSPRVKLVLTDPDEDSFDQDASTDDSGYDEESSECADARDAHNKEYDYIAKEISHLIKNHKKADGQPIRPCDIAILVRTQSQINSVTEVLKARSISAVSPTNDDLFRTPEVLLMTALLKVIDNPTDDVALAGLLRSPVFDFSIDELIHLRKQGGAALSLYEELVKMSELEDHESDTILKCRIFIEWLEKYRLIAESMPIDRLLRVIYRDPRCAFAGGSDSLTKFYDYARKYESGSFRGLYNFLRYIDSIKDQVALSSGEFVPDENAVTVMTIHKSKGLEFPVCFVAGMSHKFNLGDLNSDFVFDRSTGVAMNIADDTGFALYKTPLRFGINVNKRSALMEEEMRVLYVAMTRARERLYVTANVPHLKKTLDRYDNTNDIRDLDGEFNVSSYLPWILRAVSRHLAAHGTDLSSLANGTSPYASDPEAILEIIIPQDKADEVTDMLDASEKSSSDLLTETDKDDTEALYEIFKKRFSFEYPHSHIVDIPAKMSVSKLSPEILDGLDEFDSPIGFGKRKEIILETNLFDSIDPQSVKKEPTPAEKGTATHLVFQFCDFEYLKSHGARAELGRLLEKRYIPSSTLDIIRKNEIEIFAQSELFERICNARCVYREQRFNLNFNASDFTSNEELRNILSKSHETLLVQGVIDIFFEDADGRLVLCDYKTDRITEKMLHSDTSYDDIRGLMTQRHGEQLSYYRKAVKELFGRYPDEVIIYLTQNGLSYHIDI